MDANRMQQQALQALPSATDAKTHGGEGAEQQQQQQQHHDHAVGTVVHAPNKPGLVYHGKHQQTSYYYQLDGLPPMSNEQQQQQQQMHYPGPGYPPMQYYVAPPPGTDMAHVVPGGPGDNMPPGGPYSTPSYMPMMCAVHAGPQQQQQLLSDAAQQKRRQRLDKNKESVRNYRKKKREEETRYKYYVTQLECTVQQTRAAAERLEQDKAQLEHHVQLLGNENKQLKSRMEQLEEKTPPSC